MKNVIENLVRGQAFTVPVGRDLNSPVYIAEAVTTWGGCDSGHLSPFFGQDLPKHL